MFCPSCALEDRNQSQFCRGCGMELHLVRNTLERNDAIINSAATAREEIGHAIAAKIKETRSARDLKKIAEEVLPRVEEFLESPEERRLRHLREGVITSAVALGVILFCLVLGSLFHRSRDMEVLATLGAGASVVIFLVGLGIVINARWFTVAAKGRIPTTGFAKQQILTDRINTGSLQQAPTTQSQSSMASVTEGTTRELR